MLYIFSNPLSLSLVVILASGLIAGVIAVLELYNTIFPDFVTSASTKLLGGLYRFAVIVAIVYFEIAILRVLIGGGTNAL